MERIVDRPGNMLQVLHYLFSHSAGRVVAHCLDLDLVTSGADMAEAEESLHAVVLAQIGCCYPTGNFSQLDFRAPSEYWQALLNGKDLDPVRLEVDVPPVVLPVKRSSVMLRVYRHEVQQSVAAA
jgi:hypothetical protein